MKKTKIYLDTSVISAYFDIQKPVRQLITQKWMDHDLKDFVPYVSSLVLSEIEANRNTDLKKALFEFIDNHKFSVIEMTQEIEELASEYRKKVIPKEINDSLHIAAASVYQLQAIVSWNFKHIVNLKTVLGIHQVNLERGFPLVEIMTPENLGGAKYGNV